jgi:lipopolysaccharide export LptBFGC system permease protein LptF
MDLILPGETLSVLIWIGITVFLITVTVLILNKQLTNLEKFALFVATFFIPIVGGLFALGYVYFPRKK